MATPHKATPEQWEAVRKTAGDRFGSYPSHSVITELADRLAAAEQRISDLEAGRSCTCHPDDNPPVPCARRYALDECCEAASAPADHLRDVTKMVATDAELQAVFWPDSKVTGTQGIRAVYDLGRQHGAANSSAGLTSSSHPAKPDSSPAPAGGLVERVAKIVAYGGDPADWQGEARAAILAVADWFTSKEWHVTAASLRHELERHG